MNNDEYFKAPFSAAEDAIALENTRNEYYFDEGMKKGVKEGIKEGTEKKNLEVAKGMLKENIDINIITKITGLTKKEIIESKEV